jgi:hypothetical protein
LYTQVKFLKPFVFVGTVSTTLYNITVNFEPNSSLGVCYGYLDAYLATELIALGVVEAVV